MIRTAVRWILAVAALTLAACGGAQQQPKPPAAVKLPRPPETISLKITFTEQSKTSNSKADCAAMVDPKHVTVHHLDTVQWTLYNSGCTKYAEKKVHLPFDKHTFFFNDDPGGASNIVWGVVDIFADKGPHDYHIKIKGDNNNDEDAGDPDIDVNDCGREPPAR